MLRFPRRVGERFVALVRADSAGVRAGFVALLISSGGDLVTGIALGLFTNRLAMLPGLIVLVPAAIGMRGNVFGALGSRLGTQIHAGTFRLSRRVDTEVGQNATAAMVSSDWNALMLAAAVVGLEPSSLIDNLMVRPGTAPFALSRSTSSLRASW